MDYVSCSLQFMCRGTKKKFISQINMHKLMITKLVEKSWAKWLSNLHLHLKK